MIKYTLNACLDCIAYAVDDTVPENRPELRADIVRVIGSDARHIAINDDDTSWFSRGACECCGSPLGGTRMQLNVLGNEAA